MAETAQAFGAPDAVQRLAAARGGDAFFGAHHVEASRRLMRLFGRARLNPRVTMSYDPTRTGSSRGQFVQADLSLDAAEARRLLALLARRLPGDCWGVLSDVCAFDKGLQEIEQERGWPRRSAKLVLRIGLDQLAALHGLAGIAEGRGDGELTGWLPERPPMFGNDPAEARY